MLVGREDERAEIDALLEDVRRGRSRVLVFTGEAGIGKTALLEYARERAAGMRVLAVAGVESESNLPYGALHALLRPILDSLAGLPDRQRIALSAALALEASEEPDRLATYAGTLTLLDDVASERPLLVVLDDAHWIDRESAEAVAFVCRRMAGVDLAIVAAVRDGEPSSFDHSSLPTRAVGPLTEQQSLNLLELRHGEAIGSGAARALAAISVGNPLALIELPTTLSQDQLAGREPLEEPLPVAMRIEQAFLRRTERLPADTRLSVLVAAASADSPLAALREAAAAVGGGSLDSAESEGLLRIERDRVRFAHPLLRSAVYQAAEPGLRRRVHEALAAALLDEPDRRAWQLAAAAEGPDEATAAALEQAADRAVSRGGHAARARALERAADLSPDPVERARRMFEAALAAFWAGEGDRVSALCERALALADDPLFRADAVHLRCALDLWHGRGHMVSASTLEQEIARVSDLDPERAAKLLLFLGRRHLVDLDLPQVESIIPKLEAVFPDSGVEWQSRIRVSIAAHHQMLGDTDRARAAWDEAAVGGAHAYVAFAPFPMWLERYDEVRSLLGDELEHGRREHSEVRIGWSLGCMAALELWLGRLQEARRFAGDALMLAEAVGPGWLPSLNHSTLATIDAIQGREDSSRERAREAARLAAQSGEAWQEANVKLAPALLALGLGRYAEVVELLRPVDELVRPTGLAEPGMIAYHANLIEAYVRLGMVDEAASLLEHFERQGEQLGRMWVLAAAARCQGLLATPDEIDRVFGFALERHDDVPSPFERARTELVYGERLRRANRRRDARPHLRAALRVFGELGAEPWLERAHAELRATGERVPHREPDEREQLTPQELQIATLVAEGMTNREIGAQIFLSPKTVEYHLTRVYRKLDLHSRAELIKQFAAGNRDLEASRV